MEVKNYNKPQWLIELENQSWQTEMVASGLAIVGSISLGPLLKTLSENLIPLFADSTLKNLDAVFLYLFNAQIIMVMCFILHLSLRILWAGFLGLGSVYKDGISTKKNLTYSSSFVSNLKKEFSDLAQYSMKLDKVCSVIFSVICALLMILISLSFWILVLILVSNGLKSILKPEVYAVFTRIFAYLILVFFLFAMLVTSGPLKDKKIGRKYGYKTNQVLSKILFLIAYEPIGYIMWTLRTNANMRRFYVIPFALLVPMGILTALQYDAYLDNFSAKDFYYQNQTIYDHKNYNYEDELHEDRRLAISIQSRVIDQNHLEVFIPILQREQRFRDTLCGLYIPNKDLPKRERKSAKAKYYIDCAENYYQFKIDTTAYNDIQYSYSKHPNKQEKGLQLYLDIETLPKGEHVLYVQTPYTYKNEKGALRQIPFYKSH